MAGPRHALTLRSKGQRSNPKPKPRVRVLTFAMGMGRDAEQLECACRYDCTFLQFTFRFSFFFIDFIVPRGSPMRGLVGSRLYRIYVVSALNQRRCGREQSRLIAARGDVRPVKLGIHSSICS